MTDSTSMQPNDFLAREHAVDPTRSFIVSAPAGSGKTGLLTLRVLNLLARVDKPEEILCITFTRKAAQEMHERIFNTLHDATQIAPESKAFFELDAYEQQRIGAAHAALENDKQKKWELLKSPQRLAISTIDGFCKGLCNQLPFFSGMGTNTGIIDFPEAEYRHAVLMWLTQRLGKNVDPQETPLKTLIDHLNGDIDRLSGLLSQLLGVRDQWLPLIYSSESTKDQYKTSELRIFFESIIEQWVQNDINAVIHDLFPYESELCDLFSYAVQHLETPSQELLLLSKHDHFIVEGRDAAAYWRALSSFLLTKNAKASFRKKLDKRDGFPTEASAATTSTPDRKEYAKQKKQQALGIIGAIAESIDDIHAFGDLRKLPDPIYSESQWEVLHALFAVLPEVVAFLRLRFVEMGATDFSEFSLAAVQALNTDSLHAVDDSDKIDPQLSSAEFELLQRLDYRIQHILIDEFQDTSQIQLALLKSLTAEWQLGDGRTLFLVGDGMQSCYSFRNANVGIFLNLREQGLENIDINALNLDVNFRSKDAIVDWVNHHFEHAFPRKNNADFGAVKYIPSIAFNQAPHGEGKKPSSFIKHKAFTDIATSETVQEGQGAIEQEAVYIAQSIKALNLEYPDESIAVLVKSRAHVTHIIEQFKSDGIAYQAVEIDGLSSKQYIKDLATYAKILINPRDRLAWLAALRTPICALNHHDLFCVFNSLGSQSAKSTVPQLIQQCLLFTDKLPEGETISDDGRARLTYFWQLYTQHCEFVGRRAFSEVLELAWLDFGGVHLLKHRSELDDIQTYLALIDQHEHYGQLDWQAFENSIDKRYATVSEKAENPVQIMTMHKSKGLEFDSVFLPQLNKASKADDPELLYWLERSRVQTNENSARGVAQIESDFILSPLANSPEHPDPLSDFIKNQKRRKQQLEETRVFYVACTRAKKRLILSAVLQANNESGGDAPLLKAPADSSLLGKIWPTAHELFEHPELAHEPTSVLTKPHYTEENEVGPAYIYALPKPSQNTRLKSYLNTNSHDHAGSDTLAFNNEDIDLIGDALGTDNLAARVGTAFHSVLEQIGDKGLKHFLHKADSQREETLRAVYRQYLLLAGVPEQALDDQSKLFSVAVQKLQMSEIAQWIFDPSHAFARNELSLSRGGARLERLVVDRTFVDTQTETRWVIDYKTSTPHDGQSLEDFLKQERASYAPQLLKYRNAVRESDTLSGITPQHGNTQKDLSRSSAQASHPSVRVSSYKSGLFFPFLNAFTELPELEIQL